MNPANEMPPELGAGNNPNSNKFGKLRKAEQMLRCSFVYILRFEVGFFFFLIAFLS